MRTLVVKVSENAKTGKVSATYRPETSCPNTCPLFGQGCYAENHIGGSASLKQRADTYGKDSLDAVYALAVSIPKGGTLRLNVSGDFLGEDGRLDRDYAAACNSLAITRPDVTIIAYTHAWRKLSPKDFDFTVNASCDTPADVADAIAAGWATSVVEPGHIFDGQTIGGRRVITCPNVTRGVQCIDCKLCSRPTRATIAFPVHGARKGAAGRAVTAANA